jgi:hypothetical protein
MIRRYVIQVRADALDQAPADWKHQVENIDGITTSNHNELVRMQIQATEEGIEALRRNFGHVMDIEPLLGHRSAAE